jgi:hypothetical protein
MAVNIQLRRGTTAEWVASNPILAEGEVGVETDTKKLKVGDGLTVWSSLPYINLTPAIAANIYAPLISPALTGIPTAPTATAGTSTTQVATTAFVGTAVSNLIASAPGALDTLNELATALGNDASFSTTVTNALAAKAPLANPTFTGTVSGITKSMVGLGAVDNTSDENKPVSTAVQTALGLKAPLADPTFTGTVGGITKSMVGLGNVDNTTDANKPVSTSTQTALDLKAPLASPTFTGSVSFDTNVALIFEGSTADGFETTLSVADPTADRSLTFPNATGTLATQEHVASEIGTHSSDTTNIHGITDTADLATKTYADTAVSTHSSDTTNVHGITDTADLATKSYADTAAASAVSTSVFTHSSDTLDVHGIADTAALATKTYADTAVSTHNSDTTDVHGIADTSALATKTYADTSVSTHSSDTTSVHGITDTAELATKTYADTAVSTHSSDTTSVHGIADTANLATKSYADGAVSTHEADTTSVHGIADTSILVTTTGTQTLTNKTITTPAGLVKSDVGLGNVDNTADASKPVSTAQQTALDLKANLSGPTFTGTVSGITKSMVGLGNVDDTADASKPVSTAQASAIATAKSEAIADATSQVNALLAGAPAALNTLDELAAALGDDANFATTVTTSLGLKAPLASPTFTGTVTVAASGVAFTDGTQTKEGTPSRTPIIQKTASYTLSALTERDTLIEVASSSGTTITIPLNSTVAFPVGTSIDILQTSTGQVTIAGDVGVTVNATPGLKLRTTWSSATLFKRAENTWVVYGDLTA